VAQDEGTEFKPHYREKQQQKTQKKNPQCTLSHSTLRTVLRKVVKQIKCLEIHHQIFASH
jgi:ribosomal protein S20